MEYAETAESARDKNAAIGIAASKMREGNISETITTQHIEGEPNVSEKLIEQEAKRAQAEKENAPPIPGIGDNSGEVSGARLKSFIVRIETLKEEGAAIAEDVRDTYAESRATGFDPKIMRKIVSLRKQNLEKRREESELLSLYMSAINMAE